MKQFTLTRQGVLNNAIVEFKINANSIEDAYQKYLKGEFETEIINGDFEEDDSGLDFEDFCLEIED